MICRLLVLLALLLSPLICAAQELGPFEIPCANPMPAVRNGQYSLGSSVQLANGKGCLRMSEDDENCEWNVALTRAVRWGPGRRSLLVVVDRDHAAGSGSWTTVLWYVCRGDRFVQVWSESYLHGAKVTLGAHADLSITSGRWKERDAACCPSREVRQHLAWNHADQRVVLVGSTDRPYRR